MSWGCANKKDEEQKDASRSFTSLRTLRAPYYRIYSPKSPGIATNSAQKSALRSFNVVERVKTI